MSVARAVRDTRLAVILIRSPRARFVSVAGRAIAPHRDLPAVLPPSRHRLRDAPAIRFRRREDAGAVPVERVPGGGTRLLALGEVKALSTRVGVDLLARLDTACQQSTESLAKSVREPAAPKRIIVSRSGFTNELRRVADRRPDVELIDLDRLYNGV